MIGRVKILTGECLLYFNKKLSVLENMRTFVHLAYE